jgi:hypothetical protein
VKELIRGNTPISGYDLATVGWPAQTYPMKELFNTRNTKKIQPVADPNKKKRKKTLTKKELEFLKLWYSPLPRVKKHHRHP